MLNWQLRKRRLPPLSTEMTRRLLLLPWRHRRHQALPLLQQHLHIALLKAFLLLVEAPAARLTLSLVNSSLDWTTKTKTAGMMMRTSARRRLLAHAPPGSRSSSGCGAIGPSLLRRPPTPRRTSYLSTPP